LEHQQGDSGVSQDVSFGQATKTSEEYGIDDKEEFASFSAKMRRMANQQAVDMPAKTEAQSG